MKKSAFLIAGGIPPRRDSLERCCAAALAGCGEPSPRVAYIGTASGDSRMFFASMRAVLKKAGAGDVDFIRLCGKKPDADAKERLAACGAVFISGGEVEDGIRVLRERGLCDFLRELYGEGKTFFGLSAGTIMMGQRWVKWELPDDRGPSSLFDCLGLVPMTFDTHAEDEDWPELKEALRLMGPGAEGRGLPSGCMVRAEPDGSLFEAEGKMLAFRNEDGVVRRV